MMVNLNDAAIYLNV